MGNILLAFILSAPIQEDALYFEDYCGKHELDHLGREQLAGDPAAYIGRLSVAGMFSCSFLFQLSGQPWQSSPSCNVFREVVGFLCSNTRASLKNVDAIPLITFLLHSVIIFQFVLVGISSPFV